jgi:serine protease Do
MRGIQGYGPALVVLAAALTVLFAGPFALQRLASTKTDLLMVQARNRLDQGDILGAINSAQRDIADFVEPSVVHINAQHEVQDRRGPMPISSGSGWVYDEEGHVVTNYHVVLGAERIDVQLQTGEIRSAEVAGYDRSTDIAVLKIPSGGLHPALQAPIDEPVHQGDLVFAFGSPFDFRFSMSAGIVSGKHRSIDVLGRAGYENFIQVDAAINPGNSGGPLTDHLGRVIGMNTAIATGRQGVDDQGRLEEGQFAGIGLAIPLEMIVPVVTQILRNGGVVEKGLLGLVPDDLDVLAAQAEGFIGTGVRVREVHENLPAALAGVRNDDIITRVDGRAIGTPAQLRSMISSRLPGDTTVLTIWRKDPEGAGGATLEIPVRLSRLDVLRDKGELPDDQPRNQIRALGIAKMLDCTPEAAAQLGVEHHDGVLVEEAVQGSALARDLPAGSIIVEVGGHPVRGVEEFLALLRVFNLRSGARIGFIRPDGTSHTTVIRVER